MTSPDSLPQSPSALLTPTQWEELAPYLDDQRCVKTWPSKRNKKSVQTLVLRYLASKLEPGTNYSEREINQLLQRHHTFGDPALLRRELFESGLVNRTRDGFSYWLHESN